MSARQLLGGVTDPSLVVLVVRYDGIDYELAPPVSVGELDERVRAAFLGDGWLRVVARPEHRVFPVEVLFLVNSVQPFPAIIFQHEGDRLVADDLHGQLGGVAVRPAQHVEGGPTAVLPGAGRGDEALDHLVVRGTRQQCLSPVVANDGDRVAHDSSPSVGPVAGGSAPVGGAGDVGPSSAGVPTVGEPSDAPAALPPAGVSVRGVDEPWDVEADQKMQAAWMAAELRGFVFRREAAHLDDMAEHLARLGWRRP